MVATQIAARGVRDPGVLAAMRRTPRERFLPQRLHPYAHDDAPLPIGARQTISQPYMVAFMIEALGAAPSDRALEVGAGCGYAAAVLGQVAATVYAVERIPALANAAAARLADIGCANVRVRCGDGAEGWAEAAPFERIMVSAAGPEIPRELLRQLAVGGRLVMPVGPSPRAQTLLRVTRLSDGEYRREALGRVRFVPLLRGVSGADDVAPQLRPRGVARVFAWLASGGR